MRILIFFFCLLGFAVNAQVVIQDDVARYFLKRNGVVEILEKRDSLYLTLMNHYNSELFNKDKLIASYVKENSNLLESVDFFQNEAKNLADQNKTISKLLAREQRRVKLCLVGMIIIALL